MNRFAKLPAWLAFVPSITGGDDDPATTTPPPPANSTENFGSEAIGELLSRLDTKDANNKKLADDLTAAQALLKEQEDQRLSEAQKSQRDQQSAIRAAEKRATDAEAKAAQGDKAIAYAKALGIKWGIEHLADKDGKAKYQWEDTDTVYELLKHDGITVDFETGKLDGLEAQLDELAKRQNGFLLKKGNGASGVPILGVQPGGGNSGGGEGAKKTAADYADRYPSMARISGRPQQPGYAVQSATAVTR